MTNNLNRTEKIGKKLIVVVEGAFLETIRVKDRYQLLNSDDHHVELARAKRPQENARPDICHEMLLQLFDSPLNKAGLLQVYIHTAANELIAINPETKIPRTFERFCGLIVELLHKHQIRAAGTNDILLRLIEGPITKHLPLNVPVVALSVTQRLVRLTEYIERFSDSEVVIFVIGAFAHGHIDVNYSTDTVAISEYPLSAAAVAARLTTAFEGLWGVL